MSRIALFGGTFDPVHAGHLHMARLAKDALSLDQVRFLPCRISPHKLALIPTPEEIRLEMLHLATAGLPWAIVEDYELTREGPSYSYQTAGEMATRYPDDRLFWIMGGDQWDALPLWREPEKLAACVEFIVIARNDHPLPRPGYRMHLVHGEHPASATAIRAAIAAGAEDHPWLPEGLAGFIRKKGLYRS